MLKNYMFLEILRFIILMAGYDVSWLVYTLQAKSKKE